MAGKGMLLVLDDDGAWLGGPELSPFGENAHGVPSAGTVDVVGPKGFSPPVRFLRIRWKVPELTAGEKLFFLAKGSLEEGLAIVVSAGFRVRECVIAP